MAALMAAAAGVSPLVQGDSAMSRPHASIPANHTHWDGGYLHPLAVGQGGLIVSCLLVLLVGWRTFLQIRHGVRPLDIRKAFHLTLLAATLLEMPRAWYCRELIDVPPAPYYAGHLLSLAGTFTAFSMVVVTWARVFNVGEDRSTVKNAVLVCNVVYLGFTLFEVGSLLVINDTWNFVSGNAAYMALLLVFTFTSTTITVSLVGCGACALRRLAGHRNWRNMESRLRRKGMVNLVAVMSAIAVFFTLRSILVIMLFLGIHDKRGIETIPPLLWAFCADWCPRVFPAIGLLFIMRRVGRPAGATAWGAATPSLFSTPRTGTANRKSSSGRGVAGRLSASGQTSEGDPLLQSTSTPGTYAYSGNITDPEVAAGAQGRMRSNSGGR